MVYNVQMFDITFLIIPLSKNVEAMFSVHIYMLQNSFQLNKIILAPKSHRKIVKLTSLNITSQEHCIYMSPEMQIWEVDTTEPLCMYQ